MQQSDYPRGAPSHPRGGGPVNVGQALGFKRIAVLPTLQQRSLEAVSHSSTPFSPLSNTPLLPGVKHAIHTCIWEMHHTSKSSSSLHITYRHALSAAMVMSWSPSGDISVDTTVPSCLKVYDRRSCPMLHIYCHVAIYADPVQTPSVS